MKELEAYRPKEEENPSCCYSVADKLCELQKKIDEHERFLGDLLIMLVKREPQCVIEHSVPGDDKMGWIWDEVRKLIKENKELKEQLARDLEKSE